MVTLAELARITAMSLEETEEDVRELEEAGRARVFPMRKDVFVWHIDSEKTALLNILGALKEYEAKHPYRYGMKKAEVQMAYFKGMKPNVFDKVVESYEEAGQIKRVDEFLCTTDYEVLKDKTYDTVSGKLLSTFENAKYDFVRYSEIDFGKVPADVTDDILNILLEEKLAVKVTDDMYTLTSYMKEAERIIRERLKEDPVITIAQVRDLFATSRKSAKPILEYMDSIKVTKKTGAESERIAY